MRTRFGKHGGLVLLCNESGALEGVRDELYRKQHVRFKELNPVPPDNEPGIMIEMLGPCFKAVLPDESYESSYYKRLDIRLTKTGPGFSLSANGLNDQQWLPEDTKTGRYFSYFELDRPCSALLEISLALETPLTYQIGCSVKIEPDGSLLVGSEVSMWVLAGSLYPSVTPEGLSFDVPAGRHKIELVMWSKAPKRVLHSTGLLLSRSDASLAAIAALCCPDHLVAALPADTIDEIHKSLRVFREIAIETILVSQSVDADVLGCASTASEKVIRLSAGSRAIDELLDILGADSATAHVAPEIFSAGDPSLALAKLNPPQSALLTTEPGPQLKSRIDDKVGIVIADCQDPITRVLAVEFARLKEVPVWLAVPTDGLPAPPNWEECSEEDYPTLIEQYRDRLDNHINRSVPSWFDQLSPRRVVAFTDGTPYSLVHGSRGRWNRVGPVGHLPANEAPWLLTRAMHGTDAAATPFSITILCDALFDEDQETEVHDLSGSLRTTSSRPVVLTKALASGELLRDFATNIQMDFLVIVAHGAGDAVYLVDGPLSSTDIGAWALPSAPIVFNNSCASWSTTGPSFIRAGARAYIGTLWPVMHDSAIDVARTFSEKTFSETEIEIGSAFQSTIECCIKTESDDVDSYILVGIPNQRIRVSSITDIDEEIDVAEYGLRHVYEAAHRLVNSRKPLSALALRETLGEELVVWITERVSLIPNSLSFKGP